MARQRTVVILFIADIVGEPGMKALEKLLPDLKHETGADLCIANGENAWDGKSLNAALIKRIKTAGVDVITGGNHTWDRYQIHGLLKSEPGLIRPLNYPPGLAGQGWTSHLLPGRPPVVVMNVQGRVFMPTIDCPFRSMERELQRVEREVAAKGRAPIIFVDMHAEASAEKIAMAWHLDGKISALVGTHTHVQTADERILTDGTAFITDAGMSGCRDSVIGMKKEVAIRRFLLQTPHKYEAANGPGRLEGVLIKVDPEERRALSIERIQRDMPATLG
jgi:metallophosphoesterase (TIGR00282 family)